MLADKPAVICGYASIVGAIHHPDTDGRRLLVQKPDAYDIANSGIVWLCIGHNLGKRVATTSDGSLEVWIDSAGLAFQATLAPAKGNLWLARKIAIGHFQEVSATYPASRKSECQTVNGERIECIQSTTVNEISIVAAGRCPGARAWISDVDVETLPPEIADQVKHWRAHRPAAGGAARRAPVRAATDISRTPVGLVQMPSGKPATIDGRAYASVAEPARALRVSRRAIEQRPGRPQQTERSGTERVHAVTKVFGTLAGFVFAPKSSLKQWATKASCLTLAVANMGRASRESKNFARVGEVLGFEIGHIPRPLRSELVELSVLWMTVKKRQDAAIQSCDPHAFGEAHHESIEISKRIINLLQSFNPTDNK
jgi:phage head maturation protease